MQRARLPRRRRLAHPRTVRQRGRARRHPIRRRAARSAIGRSPPRHPQRHAGGADARCATRGVCDIDALGSGSDYTPVPAAPRHRLAQHRLRRRGRLRPVPLDLRLVRPLRALHRSRLRLRRGAGARSAGGTVLRLARRRPAALRVHAGRRRASRRYADEVQKLADTMRTDTTEHNRRIDDGVFTLAAESVRQASRRRSGGSRCRRSTSRR